MQTQIKVRGYHLDVYQHVNNARYLEFLEEARWHGLENSDSFHWMTAHNIAFVVVNININYRRPAVLSDLLTITSQLQQLNGKSGILSQVITLEPEGQVVADAPDGCNSSPAGAQASNRGDVKRRSDTADG